MRVVPFAGAGDAPGWQPVRARFALFVAVSLITRAGFLAYDFLSPDEAIHLQGARTLLRGGALYRDFVDIKPPLVHVFYALAQLAHRGMLSVHLATVLLVVPLIALAASAFFQHDRRGLLAGLAFLLYSAGFAPGDMHAANCELLFMVPASWAIAVVGARPTAVRPARLLAAGLLLGLAALFKQQAIACLPPVMLIAVLGRRWRASSLLGLVALLLGFALPIAITVLVFATMGLLSEIHYWLWQFAASYAANPIEPGEVGVRLLRYLLPFLAVTAPLWTACLRSLRSHLSVAHRALVALLLVCFAPLTFIGWRLFPHYFIPLYLPLSLGAAPWMAEHLRSSRLGTAVFIGTPVAALLACAALAEHRRPEDVVAAAVGAELRADLCARGAATLFVWGQEASFYYYADMAPASRFVSVQSTVAGYVPGNWAVQRGEVDASDLILPTHWDLLMGDLERRPPTYLLDLAGGVPSWRHFPLARFPRLRAFVDRGYERVGAVRGVSIYRRLDCARPAPASPAPDGAPHSVPRDAGR
jgi:hypothetical protein